MRTRVFFFLGIALLLGADRAVLPDGRERLGQLTFDATEGLCFVSANAPALPFDRCHAVFLEATDALPVPKGGPVYCLTLASEQRVYGELLGMDANSIRMRPSWSEPLSIPRDRAVALSPPPGFLPVFADAFEGGLTWRQTAGEPRILEGDAASGGRSLALRGPDQSVERQFDDPLPGGRLTMNVSAPKAGGRLDLLFREKEQVKTVRIPFTPKEGWQRVQVGFHQSLIWLSVDGIVTHSSHPPPRELTSVRIATDAGHRGEVRVDDVTLYRQVEDFPRPPRERSQDELWLRSGDQLFGKVLAADGRGARLQNRLGERVVPWSELRGVYLQGEQAEDKSKGLARVRLRRNGELSQDALIGRVRGLNDRQLTLSHPVLGELTLPRPWVEKLSPVAD